MDIQLAGYTLHRQDRTAHSGKTRGDGLCIFVNNSWCKKSKEVSRFCSPEEEYIVINCRPHYLLRWASGKTLQNKQTRKFCAACYRKDVMQPSNVCWALTIWMVQLALIVLTVQAKNCTKPIGGQNMVLSDAFITQETFVDGAKVTFQCAIGYARTGGSPSVTCTAGMWSDVKLECGRKSCGSPGEVMNGWFNLSEGVLFGDKAVATCNTGYMLVGSGVRTCMDGGWDGRVPVCEVVKCGKPPNIVNGGPVVPPEDTYDYGSVVQYDCEKDYTLVGSKSITCRENGEFQPAPPECKMVSCPPPVVENGVRIDGRPPYTYKSFVMYRCNAGYEMEGQASLTCEIEGWSAPYPTCKDRVLDATHTTPDPNNNAGKIVGSVVGVLVPSLLLYLNLILLH